MVDGTSLGHAFNTSIDQISSRGKDLQAEMNTLLAQDEVNPEDMLMIQFEMGQYNALLESLSTMTKSLSDSAKSIAQKAG